MRCWTGGFDPLDAGDEGRVNLLDIVVQLGRKGRFGDAGDPEWTVLHHSFFVLLLYLKLFADEGSHHAGIHDATEAWTGDIPAPLKRMSPEGYEAIKKTEHAYQRALYRALGLHDPSEDEKVQVKLCDWVALVIEAHLFGPPGARCWNDVPEASRDTVRDLLYIAMPDFQEVCQDRGKGHFAQTGR